jgi:hypothetical protein
MSDLVLPTDWAAYVFGRHDVTPYPDGPGVPQGDHVLAGPNFVATFVGGLEVDTTPAPTWRTYGDYHSTHLDILLGRPEADSPPWLSAAHLREATLQPRQSGTTWGIVPLSYFASVTLPTDFSADDPRGGSLAGVERDRGQGGVRLSFGRLRSHFVQ